MNKIWYHADCNDGFTAAALASRNWPKAELTPVKYDSPPPAYGAGDKILIVDFSYPRQVLEEIKNTVTELQVIDHHKTAEEALRGLSYCWFDMSRCGAGLVDEYLRRQYSSNHGLEMIEDRDLWTQRYKETAAFTAGLGLVDKEVEPWLHAVLNNWADTIEKGEVVLEYQKRTIELMIRDRYISTLHGVPVVMLNANSLISDLGQRLLEVEAAAQVAAIWYEDGDGKVKVSLRTRGDFDCTGIAKEFGGGGHKAAAGFTIGAHSWYGRLR